VREIKILQQFQHAGVVRLRDVVPSNSVGELATAGAGCALRR
jgi:hypothetical protein